MSSTGATSSRPWYVGQVDSQAKGRYTPETLAATDFFWLNDRSVPFNNILAREAANLAISRVAWSVWPVVRSRRRAITCLRAFPAPLRPARSATRAAMVRSRLPRSALPPTLRWRPSW